MAPLADSLARIGARLNGVRGRALYPPFAALGKRLRSVSRKLRGGADPKPVTRLPAVHWSALLPANPIYLVEARKELGNVTEGELALLATAATLVPSGRDVVEIGTFDGRTTLNLAINTPPDVVVNTLDLPPEMATQYALHPSERRFVEKPQPGARFRNAAPPWRERSRADPPASRQLGDLRFLCVVRPGRARVRRRLACLRVRAGRQRHRVPAGRAERRGDLARLRRVGGRDARARGDRGAPQARPAPYRAAPAWWCGRAEARRDAAPREFCRDEVLCLVALLSFASGPALAESTNGPAAKPHVGGETKGGAACPSQDFTAFFRVFSVRADLQRKYTRLPLEYGVVDMDSANVSFKTRAIRKFEDIPQYRPENGAIFPTAAEIEEDKLEIRITTRENSASGKNAPPEKSSRAPTGRPQACILGKRIFRCITVSETRGAGFSSAYRICQPSGLVAGPHPGDRRGRGSGRNHTRPT